MSEDVGLARSQLASIPWSTLRANGSPGEQVRDHLTTMLFSEDSGAIWEAYGRIENSVTAQGDLSPCAPYVVSVIMAAAAERQPGDRHLGTVFDLLGLTLAGVTARWEVEIGTRGLRAACYREAAKGYWALRRLAAATPDPEGVVEMARIMVDMIDHEEAEPPRIAPADRERWSPVDRRSRVDELHR